MGIFNNLFGSKKQPQSEKENREEEVPDEVKRLKSRDGNKDSIFFYKTLNKIIKNRESVAYKLRDQYIQENNLVALKNFGNNISSDIYTYISYWYSMGESINENWQNFYLTNLKFYLLAINKQTLLNGLYTHSSKILAIGILLNIDREEFKKISERYVEEGYEDFVLDGLVHLKYHPHPISDTLQFPGEIYIQKLSAILKSTSKQEAEAIVKDTLENHFYTRENLQTAYESHKTEFYSGYWAWELAALVKVMGLDDSSFKDNPYYPYDLVHWTGGN